MKAWHWLGCAGVLAIALLAGCGRAEDEGKTIRIGVSIPAATHGWTGGVVWNAEEAAKSLEAGNPDVKVLIATSADSADQVNRIENLLSRDLQALVVMSQEPGPVTAICEEAARRGVYLVVVSNPLDRPVQNLFVNGDNRSFGAAAAEAMGKLLPEGGDIVVMEGIPCPINTDRVEGFRQVLTEKYPKIRILASQSAGWNTEKGLALMENYLQKYPKIDAVWAGDDDVLIGAVKAYEESGRQDIKAMVGGGGSKDTVRKVRDGDPLVRATVTYSPRMIRTAMEQALTGVRNGGKPVDGQAEILIPSQVVTQENAAQHYYPDSVY